MHCPNCDAPAIRGANKVVQARNDTVESKIRQRKCMTCGHKWWTCETDLPVGAIKWVQSDDPDTNSFSVPRRQPGFLRISYS
jgi:transcriptional regulator NrdR family protein